MCVVSLQLTLSMIAHTFLYHSEFRFNQITSLHADLLLPASGLQTLYDTTHVSEHQQQELLGRRMPAI